MWTHHLIQEDIVMLWIALTALSLKLRFDSVLHESEPLSGRSSRLRMIGFAGAYPFETTDVIRIDPLEDIVFEVDMDCTERSRIKIKSRCRRQYHHGLASYST